MMRIALRMLKKTARRCPLLGPAYLRLQAKKAYRYGRSHRGSRFLRRALQRAESHGLQLESMIIHTKLAMLSGEHALPDKIMHEQQATFLRATLGFELSPDVSRLL